MTDQQSPLVSVLFITYKRFDMLEQCVRAFRKNTNYSNLELVIADDGSGPEIQAQIRTLPADVFALEPKNRGLGANNNNGLRHCSGKYILMIQDDWMCQGPPDYLSHVVDVLESNPDVGIINFAGSDNPPDRAMPLHGKRAGAEPCYVTPHPLADGRKEHFLYNDQPHIRSRAALEHVGLYIEDRDMERCEDDYSRRWKRQTRFLTAVFPAYYRHVFSDEGDAQGRSHRLNKFRYRVLRHVMPVAMWLKQNCKPAYRAGRWLANRGIGFVEKLRLVR